MLNLTPAMINSSFVQDRKVIHKKCPWCNESIGLYQLGRRPARRKPKWFQLSRDTLVCPYCAGAVRLSGKSKWFLLLLLPSFILLLVKLLTGQAFMPPWLGWGLFVIGACVAYLFAYFEKDEHG